MKSEEGHLSQMHKYLMNGSFYLQPDWLDYKLFTEIKAQLPKFKYKALYQPHGTYYGNRFQAYPCYEIFLTKYNSIFIPKFEDILQKKIEKKSFRCIVRKAIIEEVKKSKVSTPFAIVHSDPSEIAAVLYFDQTPDGGTVFFENRGDKYPDTSIGAYPNRLLMYNGKRWHAVATDFTFKERYVLAFFFNILKI